MNENKYQLVPWKREKQQNKAASSFSFLQWKAWETQVCKKKKKSRKVCLGSRVWSVTVQDHVGSSGEARRRPGQDVDWEGGERVVGPVQMLQPIPVHWRTPSCPKDRGPLLPLPLPANLLDAIVRLSFCPVGTINIGLWSSKVCMTLEAIPCWNHSTHLNEDNSKEGNIHKYMSSEFRAERNLQQENEDTESQYI